MSIRLYCAVAVCLITLVLAAEANGESGALMKTGGIRLDSAETSVKIASNPHDDDAGHLSLSEPDSALAVRLGNTSEIKDASGKSTTGRLAGPLGTTIGALGITLAVFAVVIAVVRRVQANRQTGGLPREAVEVLGEVEIGPRQKLVVVRCGLQALVVGVSSAGIQQVAQIDDPDEAGQFLAQCRGLGSATTFHSTLREMEREKTERGFIGADDPKRSGNKLFLRA